MLGLRPAHRFVIFLATTLALFTAGCVSSQRYPRHDSWPKPVTAKSLEQFGGVFQNREVDSQTGEAARNGNRLFVYLLGPTHASANRGERVEIRADDGGQQLKVRLLDEQGGQIDSGILHRGIDFEFADGRIIVIGPYSGLRSLNNNFGPGLTLQRDRLYLAESGDLLASYSENSVILWVMLIPGVLTKKWWMFWPKLGE